MSNPLPKSHTSPLPEICPKPDQLVLTFLLGGILKKYSHIQI